MAKELKQLIFGHLKDKYTGLEGCVVVDYRGLNSEQTHDLRVSLRKSGVRMNVVQNRLARRALADLGMPQEFQDLLKGPTAILVGEDGAISASRTISQWRKKNKDAAAIKGGLFQGKTIKAAEVEKLATLPDRDTLLGRGATLLLGPAMTLANATQSLLTHLVSATKAYREEKGESGGAGTA